MLTFTQFKSYCHHGPHLVGASSGQAAIYKIPNYEQKKIKTYPKYNG